MFCTEYLNIRDKDARNSSEVEGAAYMVLLCCVELNFGRHIVM
jgi:hypothetical protein